MNLKKLLPAFSLLIYLSSCEKKEPAVTSLQKDHSVEVSLETKRLGDTAVLLTTRQQVYLKGTLVKTIFRTDTLPAAGDTIQTVENDDSTFRVKTPKEYEFFVTVK